MRSREKVKCVCKGPETGVFKELKGGEYSRRRVAKGEWSRMRRERQGIQGFGGGWFMSLYFIKNALARP